MKAAGCLIKHDEKILLLRRKDDSEKHESSTWGLVGGSVEFGESSQDAVIRETKEEVGIDLSKNNSFSFVRNFELEYDDLDETVYFDLYKAKYKTKPKIDMSDEHYQFKWFSPEKAYQRSNLMTGLYPILEDVYNLK